MEIELMESRESIKKKDQKPPIIKWKDAWMIRSQSIRAVAHEIMNMSSNQDLISINVIGKQSTGKTEICRTLAHLIHQMADEPYSVSFIGKKEFINLEETIAGLKPTNHILIFDDIAFLKAGASTKQIDQMQYVLSIIRHLPSAQDVKIIIFKSFQYSKSIPPFLRQNDLTFISSVDANEYESILVMLGKNHARKIKRLQKMQVQVKLGEKDNAWFHFPIDIRETKYFKYHAKHPFLPYLYYNGISCRIVVNPLRTWIDPICNICDDQSKIELKEKTFNAFIEDFDKKFGGQRIAITAVKEVLSRKGIITHTKNIATAIKYIEKFTSENNISLKEIQKYYGLTERKVRLRKNKQPIQLEKN